MKIPVSALTLAASLLLLAGSHASAQIVQNGDFEDNAAAFTQGDGYVGGSNPTTITHFNLSAFNGGLSGYDTNDTATDFDPTGYSMSDPGSFIFLQNQNNAGGQSEVTQGITLASFKTYTLTFEAAARKNDTSMGNVSVIAGGAILGNPSVDFTASGTSDFVKYTTTFTTGSDVSGATITLKETSPLGSDNTVDISDISIKAAPEPASTALIGLGACALLFVTLRARLKS